jgi:hypothetical protein
MGSNTEGFAGRKPRELKFRKIGSGLLAIMQQETLYLRITPCENGVIPSEAKNLALGLWCGIGILRVARNNRPADASAAWAQ